METINRLCMTRLTFCDRDLIRKGFELAYHETNSAPDTIALNTTEPRAIETSSLEKNSIEVNAKIASFALLDYGLDQASENGKVIISIAQICLANIKTLPVAQIKGCLVLQLGSDIEANSTTLAALKGIRSKGFQVALSDYGPNDHRQALLSEVDMVTLNSQRFILGDMKKLYAELRHYPICLLVSRIESWQAFEKLRPIGFDLYQGSFLAKPELLDTPKNSANRVVLLRLLALLFDDTSSLAKIELVIEQEPTLFYRLLKFVNSAAYRLPNKVDSLHQAVVYIGTETLRTLVAILVWAKDDHKAYAVFPQILTRAKSCELLAKELGYTPVDRYFTLGFLSLLDVALDQPLNTLIKSLAVSSEMQSALIDNEGPLAEVLNFVRLWEKADWQALEQHPLFSSEQTPELMQQAQHWAVETEVAMYKS